MKSSFYPHAHYHYLCDVPEPLNGELSPLVNRARVVRCCHSHEFATLCSNIFSLQNIICEFHLARTRKTSLSPSLFIRDVPNHHHQQHSASCWQRPIFSEIDADADYWTSYWQQHLNPSLWQRFVNILFLIITIITTDRFIIILTWQFIMVIITTICLIIIIVMIIILELKLPLLLCFWWCKASSSSSHPLKNFLPGVPLGCYIVQNHSQSCQRLN